MRWRVGVQVGLWLLLSSAVQAATLHSYITLKPDTYETRNQTATLTLAPGYQGIFHVSIADNAHWRFHSSSSEIIQEHADMFWLIQGSGRSYSNKTVNTGWLPMQSIARVLCEWRPIGEEGDGGGEESFLTGCASNIANATIIFELLPVSNPSDYLCLCPSTAVELHAVLLDQHSTPHLVNAQWNQSPGNPAGDVNIQPNAGAVVSVNGRVIGLTTVTATLDLLGWPLLRPSDSHQLDIIGVDIAQSNVYHCAMSARPATFSLDQARSHLAPRLNGTVRWIGGPTNEFLGEGDPLTFTVPTDCPPGVHIITAYSTLLTNCLDTAKLTIIKVNTETVADIPADRSRKKLGIGEDVKCTFQPPMSVTWNCTGGELSTLFGENTVFYAMKTPGVASVTATIDGASCTVDFTIVKPSGQTSQLFSDLSMGTVGPPNNHIGARSRFKNYTHPDDVSFYMVQMREYFPTGQNTWTWPDGTTDSFEHAPVEWRTTAFGGNVNYDTSSSDLFPIDRIYNGLAYVSFGYDINFELQWKGDGGDWTTWFNPNHPKEFRGNDRKARTIFEVENTVYGGWMGPWQ